MRRATHSMQVDGVDGGNGEPPQPAQLDAGTVPGRRDQSAHRDERGRDGWTKISWD